MFIGSAADDKLQCQKRQWLPVNGSVPLLVLFVDSVVGLVLSVLDSMIEIDVELHGWIVFFTAATQYTLRVRTTVALQEYHSSSVLHCLLLFAAPPIKWVNTGKF